jgi:spore maturation protein CgeB
LTERALGLENHYAIGREIAVFDDTCDLLQKVDHYLKHPQERDLMARAAFARTQQEHIYDARMKDVLAFALAARDRRLHSLPGPVPSIDQAEASHRLGLFLRAVRLALLAPFCLAWGPERGPRAARRFLHELSWRFAGRKTYSASGWPGRMFPGV